MLILRCLTGSRLYGTASESSDWDYINVWDKLSKSKHKIKDDQDEQHWSLSTFMKLAINGGHNSHDVMWSPRGVPEVDLITDMRLGFRINPWDAWPRYRKTIETLLTRGDAKGRLHAMRLEYNLTQIEHQGWVDPTEWARTTDWRSIT